MRIQTLFLFVYLLSLTACHKESSVLKSTSYTLVDQRNTGLTGTVTFTERMDTSSLTKVDIAVKNTIINGRYAAHIHLGPPSHYRYVLFDFGQMNAEGNQLTAHRSIPLPYDSAVVFDGTFVFHDMTGDTVLAICGIGKNK